MSLEELETSFDNLVKVVAHRQVVTEELLAQYATDLEILQCIAMGIHNRQDVESLVLQLERRFQEKGIYMDENLPWSLRFTNKLQEVKLAYQGST